MSILTKLSALALRSTGRAVCEAAGVGVAAAGVDVVVNLLERRFTDNSQKLTLALARANGKAWRAMEVSLAGSSWWEQCKLSLTSADDRAIRQQVQVYLQAHPLDGSGHGPDFRGQCLAQLQAVRKAKLLDRDRVDPAALARQVGDLSRFGDASAVVDAEVRGLEEIAAHLRKEGYEALATFITLRPASGPPLLLAAMRFFFQREVERDPQLFQGLAHARLEKLAESQQAGFADLAEALDKLGDRLEGLLENVQSVVAQTHADVLDIKAEMARQSQQMQELGKAVLAALDQHQLARRELHQGDSLSVRDEGERRLVRDLVKRYRALPAQQRQQMPALLNAVGKLEVVTGDFESAQRDFSELITLLPETVARAEAAHNAYRAALEQRAWAEALASLKEAVQLAPGRFELFPGEKYEPERILGAGGFGVAFLCRNRHSGGRMVIKTLLRDGLDRDLGEVFREAQTLEELEHPAIIRIRDCDYADAAHTRPYFVMDYFPGATLAEYVEKNGTLSPGDVLTLAKSMASGLHKAHSRGILHRDIKPANVLVRHEGARWEVKLIDFGLALRAHTPGSTRTSSLDRTLAGSSIAGTLDYAAPEQMGKLKGVPVGTYSDVYGFARTCCFALFGTPQPTFQHWQKLPASVAELLGKCLSDQPKERPEDFGVVLGELDRLGAPAAAKALPVQPVVLDAQPVEEAKAKPARTRTKSRRYEEDEEARPRKKPRSGFRTVGCLCFVLALGAGLYWGPAMVWRILFPTSVAGWPRPGSSWGNEPKAEPIEEKDFPSVLAELEARPNLEQLTKLAQRLAVTEPTEAQKEKHKRYESLRSLGASGAGKTAGYEDRLKEVEKADEIRRVSLALNPLLLDTDVFMAGQARRKIGAEACQRWGTSENVVELIGILGMSHGGQGQALAAGKALARIGDQRGVAPLVRCLDNISARHEGIAQAIIDYGPQAEDEVLKKLESGDGFVRGEVLKILRAIGTKKSLPALDKAASDRFRGRDAQQVIEMIKARYPAGEGSQ